MKNYIQKLSNLSTTSRFCWSLLKVLNFQMETPLNDDGSTFSSIISMLTCNFLPNGHKSTDDIIKTDQ